MYYQPAEKGSCWHLNQRLQNKINIRFTSSNWHFIYLYFEMWFYMSAIYKIHCLVWSHSQVVWLHIRQLTVSSGGRSVQSDSVLDGDFESVWPFWPHWVFDSDATGSKKVEASLSVVLKSHSSTFHHVGCTLAAARTCAHAHTHIHNTDTHTRTHTDGGLCVILSLAN